MKSNNEYNYMDDLGVMVNIDVEFNHKILAIADFIIEYNASYKEAAIKFQMGKSTIAEYMKYKLPFISLEKSKKVNEVVAKHLSQKLITAEMKERVVFEYGLLKRGYNLTQIAYLTNNSYSSTQRDLSARLSMISEDRKNEVESILENNQSHGSVTDEMRERISLEYELLKRGYSLNQIAYLINGKYSTVQRDLSKQMGRISDSKAKDVEQQLKQRIKFKKIF